MEPSHTFSDDTLRQECIEILTLSGRPSKQSTKHSNRPQFSSSTSFPLPPLFDFNAHEVKEKCRKKNEEYVQALKGVMQARKNAGIKRNVRATEKL